MVLVGVVALCLFLNAAVTRILTKTGIQVEQVVVHAAVWGPSLLRSSPRPLLFLHNIGNTCRIVLQAQSSVLTLPNRLICRGSVITTDDVQRDTRPIVLVPHVHVVSSVRWVVIFLCDSLWVLLYTRTVVLLSTSIIGGSSSLTRNDAILTWHAALLVGGDSDRSAPGLLNSWSTSVTSSSIYWPRSTLRSFIVRVTFMCAIFLKVESLFIFFLFDLNIASL